MLVKKEKREAGSYNAIDPPASTGVSLLLFLSEPQIRL